MTIDSTQAQFDPLGASPPHAEYQTAPPPGGEEEAPPVDVIDDEGVVRILELLTLDNQYVRGDPDAAIDFLQHIHSGETWHLVAFNPSGGVEATPFVPGSEQAAAARQWIAARHSTGTYFHVNKLIGPPTNGKASKADVAEGTWLHVDLDLPRTLDWSDTGTVKAAVLTLIARVNAYPLPPTIIVWSGGGLHAYWKLAESFPIGGDIQRATEFERYTRRIATDLGARVIQRTAPIYG